MANRRKHQIIPVLIDDHPRSGSYNGLSPITDDSENIHKWLENDRRTKDNGEKFVSYSRRVKSAIHDEINYSSSRSKQVESEREISEITHDNTFYGDGTLDRYELFKHDDQVKEPLLIKEITETIEIDDGSDNARKKDFALLQGSKHSFDELEDCEDTRVTMIRDIRANIVGIDDLKSRNNLNGGQQSYHGETKKCKKFQPRVDLETLYIVQHARKQHEDNSNEHRNIPVIKEDRGNSRLAERLQMNDLLRLNDFLTNEESESAISSGEDYHDIVYEEEITRRYELHESHNSVCLLIYIGEIGEATLKRFKNVQQQTLKKYEERCSKHLDVIISSGLDNFVLPYKSDTSQRSSLTDSKYNNIFSMVSVNYIRAEDRTLLGCEKRELETLSNSIRAALNEPKAKIGKTNQYLAILVVSVDACRNYRDRVDSLESALSEDERYKCLTSFTSHQIVEHHQSLLNDLRRNIQNTIENSESVHEVKITRMCDSIDQHHKFVRKDVQDEAIQVKPLMCDTAVNSSVRNSIRRSVIIRPEILKNKQDASTSPIPSELLESSKDDEYVADIFCTNLNLDTDRKPVSASVKRQGPLQVENAQSSVASDVKIDDNRQSYDYNYLQDVCDRDNLEEPSEISGTSTIIHVGEDEITTSSEALSKPGVYKSAASRHLNSKPYSGAIPIKRISQKPQPVRINKFKQDSTVSQIKGTLQQCPIVVQSKDVLIGETLDQLRRSIRQHPCDTYRVHLDTKQRCNSWSFNGFAKGQHQHDRIAKDRFHQGKQTSYKSTFSQERNTDRHVRAKLIPIWNTRSSKEYFARVEDYINEDAARSIKRSYSTSYLTQGTKSRIRWVRIPGETIRIEERRIVDVCERPTMQQPRHNGIGAQCRELPYELRYWNILQLLNKEKESGRQLGRIYQYPLEEWILTNNFKNEIEQTAEEILSPQYQVKSPEDNALVWFLTYDENAKHLTKKYIDTLLTQGTFQDNINKPTYYSIHRSSCPNVKQLDQQYRRIERFVRYERLPDRVVPIRENTFSHTSGDYCQRNSRRQSTASSTRYQQVNQTHPQRQADYVFIDESLYSPSASNLHVPNTARKNCQIVNQQVYHYAASKMPPPPSGYTTAMHSYSNVPNQHFSSRPQPQLRIAPRGVLAYPPRFDRPGFQLCHNGSPIRLQGTIRRGF